MAVLNQDVNWARDFNLRSTSNAETTRFLVKNAKNFKLEEAKTMISIGPGYGDIDSAIVNGCAKHLEHYIAVEPDDVSLNALSTAIIRRPNLKVTLEKAEYPNCKGPTEPVDVVFVSQVLYHIQDRKAAIKQFYDWLKPGGTVIFMQHCGKNAFGQIGSSKGYPVLLYLHDHLKEDLAKCGFHDFEESIIESEITTDPSDAVNVKQHFRNFVEGIPESEMDNLVKLFKEHCEKNGCILPNTDACIKIEKPIV